MKENLLLLKNMTSISKDVYIDKLDDIVIEYNNVYRRIIKMKLADVKSSKYSDFPVTINDKLINDNDIINLKLAAL